LLGGQGQAASWRVWAWMPDCTPHADPTLAPLRGSVSRVWQGAERGVRLQGCKVRATKQIMVHAAPNVLVVHLKRFEYSLYGHKISRKVRRAPERPAEARRDTASFPRCER
jgi:hypothetical protein